MPQKILIVILFCVFIDCRAQQKVLGKLKRDTEFSAKGYLINLYGKNGVWIFQPILKETPFIFDSFDGRSFFVQDMVNDLGYTCLHDIYGTGKKIAVSFYDVTQKKQVKDSMEYTYCKITILPTGTLSKIKSDKCDYIFYYKDVQKGLSCIYFDNYVTAVIPIKQ